MFNVKKQQKKNLRIFFRVSFQNDFKIIYFFVLNNSFDLNFGLKQISFFYKKDFIRFTAQNILFVNI